ncbi:MAG TPA: flagellar assembly protein FliW [Acidimicrobiales bacterium]|nr:flagellar assembly protein FliW [Acidimicrobiales bacterium]
MTELRTLEAMELTFPAGMPGIPGARRFALRPLGGGGLNVFGCLTSLEPIRLAGGEQVVSFLVAAPGLLWPDYRVEVDDGTQALLEIAAPDEAAALVLVDLHEDVGSSTANLFAPIIVNRRLALAAQLVPARTEEEVGWPIEAPITVLAGR